jgi:hypothetical protein
MTLWPILQFVGVGSGTLSLTLLLAMAQAHATTCTTADFAKAVDEAGAGLRTYNSEAQPKINAKMQQLKAAKKWPDDGFEERAIDYLRDDRTAKLDAQSNELLAKIDQLGRPSDPNSPDCSKLNELRASGVELLAVMKAKSSYLLAKMDSEIASAKPETKAAQAKPAEKPAQAKKDAGEEPARQAQKTKPAKRDDAIALATPPPAPDEHKPRARWNATTTTVPEPPPSITRQPLPDARPDEPYEDGYTVEEIRDATRGFFGTISTNLASVLEHAVKSWGRPTGYVLGNEGGGALLAGLRYGKGTLYMRSGGTRQVYWHGPSLGSDVGASGSRTMFLIYRLRQPSDLMRSFTGLDGSAYLVGGVGFTFLKGGEVIMAPIRSGVGLRLGANIGYIRFTDHPTWNPF